MDVKQAREENKQKGVLSCKLPYRQLKLNLLVGDPGNSEESAAWSCLGTWYVYVSVINGGWVGGSVHEHVRTEGFQRTLHIGSRGQRRAGKDRVKKLYDDAELYPLVSPKKLLGERS